jgi:hypothetical protein
MSHEVARDQFALGVIVQSDKGAVLRTQAQELIADLGVTDVLGDLCAHYPELVQPG